eukprot:6840223-Pyramimonas_sp.AAC.1
MSSRQNRDVYRTAVDGPLLSVVWVDEARTEGVKSRICATPFNMPEKPENRLYTPTPGASTLRCLYGSISAGSSQGVEGEVL